MVVRNRQRTISSWGQKATCAQAGMGDDEVFTQWRLHLLRLRHFGPGLWKKRDMRTVKEFGT